MGKSLKSATIASWAFSAVFLAAALAFWPGGPMQRLGNPGLLVERSVCHIGDVPTGSDLVANFTLTNLGTKAMNVLGSTSACTPQACLDVDGLPTRIEALEVKKIVVRVKTNGAGPLSDEVVLFTDDIEHREVALRVEGHVIQGSSGGDATD